MEKSGLHEILNALKLHSEHIDKKIEGLKFDLDKRLDSMNHRLDSMENRMDTRFDRLEKKVDGIRVDLSETQETVNFLSSKYAQHEKKIQGLMNQQP
ncbi:hypothetical protein [Bacillus sp. B15-48]|uniref:hypothetical protein n=1 Tax=Bacillus sp. B15-48 TaxID=1548601 RepID=UPI00193F4B58|nr:hypothetical protein [Bacillus sp. B15-48]MBM4761768.1 hypothetical protein [Bacillus sp. B15-48]